MSRVFLHFINRARRNLSAVVAVIVRRSGQKRPRYRFFSPGMIVLALSVIALCVLVLDAVLLDWSRTTSDGIRAFFGTVTEAGDSGFYLIPLGIILLPFLFSDRQLLSAEVRKAADFAIARAAFLFTAIALPSLVITILKRIIGRARPKHFESEGVWSLQPVAVDASYAAFPSGHSTTAAAVAVAFSFLVPERWRAVVLIAGFWVAFSRMVVGAHYFSDVLAGIMAGSAGAFLVAVFFARRDLVFALDSRGLPVAVKVPQRENVLPAVCALAATLFRQIPPLKPQKEDKS